MSDKKHIINADLNAFQNDLMNQKDKEFFLEHIASCDFCADQFATYMSKDLITAPVDMKTNILKAARRPELQLTVKVNAASKRMQLILYSLKVGTATLAALLLLLLSMNLTNFAVFPDKRTDESATEASSSKEDDVPLTTVIRDGMDAICNNILNFSNTIMKTEVTNNDKKEK